MVYKKVYDKKVYDIQGIYKVYDICMWYMKYIAQVKILFTSRAMVNAKIKQKAVLKLKISGFVHCDYSSEIVDCSQSDQCVRMQHWNPLTVIRLYAGIVNYDREHNS